MFKELLTTHRAQTLTVARNLASLFGIRVLQRGLGIVTVYFMVRALSQHNFGEYQFMLSVFGLLAIFNLNGLDNATMQSVSRGHLGTYRTATKIAFASSWLGSLALVGLGLWHWHDAPDFGLAFLVAAVLFPFATGLTHWKSIIIGQERFDTLMWRESITVIAINGLLIAALLTDHTRLPLLIALYLLVPAVQNLRRTYAAWKLTAAEHTSEADSVRYGIKTSLYMIISVTAEQIERLLVFFVLSPATLGLYAAADRVAEIIRGGTQDLAAVLAPRFAKLTHYPAQVDRMVRWFCLGLGALIIVFAFTLLPWLMHLLFGAAYNDAIPYAQALLCAVAVGNVGQLQFRFVRSQLDSNNFRRILIGTSAYRIIAACILVPLFGLWGVVVTIFSYRIVVSLISTWAVKRHYTKAEQEDANA